MQGEWGLTPIILNHSNKIFPTTFFDRKIDIIISGFKILGKFNPIVGKIQIVPSIFPNLKIIPLNNISNLLVYEY